MTEHDKRECKKLYVILQYYKKKGIVKVEKN